MGIRIIEGDYGSTSGAVMFDSVTDWAFGPLFNDEQEAELFISWHRNEYAGENLLRVSREVLEERFSQFRKLETVCGECGEWIVGECKECQEEDED